jgi:NADH:ubiquinone oxidoreductase subunit K
MFISQPKRFLLEATFCEDLATYDIFVHVYPLDAGRVLPSWLLISFCLFFIGLAGMVFNYKNFLVTMMSIECMYLGAVTGFITYGVAFYDITALVYGLLVLIFAACESAVGLGLLVAIYRFGRTIGFSPLTALGG